MKKQIKLFFGESCLVWVIIFLFIILGALLGCKDRTDTQPIHTEVIIKEHKAPDTISVIYKSENLKDTFTAIVPQKQLLSEIKEVRDELEDAKYIPLDSLIDAIYRSQLGITEATGHNDGEAVERYLRSVGVGRGNAWCAAFVKWCFDQAGVRTTITAWSPTAHNKRNVIMERTELKKQVQRGDVFTIYFPKLKRIGHTGFVIGKFGMNSYETVEGNTNNAGGREGDGVYLKIRPRSSLYTITRWL